MVAKRRLERSCFLFTDWANAALEMLLDNAVAFAADLFQRCPLENRHVPPIVLQHADLLKRTGDKADGRAVHSQHASQEFLGEIKVVAHHPVMRHQYPAGKPRITVVQAIAEIFTY